MIHIRILQTHEELRLVQQLERIVWTSDPTPLPHTMTSIRNGGLMLGAFIDEQLVGFSYSFAGFRDGQSYLCSHMLGIHPDYRDRGIGGVLKQQQLHTAKEMGYSLITWTYDPLETRNAYLNLSKLRTISSTYVENCYGDMNDDLNRGLPSDRLKVEWWIHSPHLCHAEPIDTSDARMIAQWTMTEDGFPRLLPANDIPVEPVVLLPVPSQFQLMKQTNKELAIEWRMQTRTIFQSLFAQGYAAAALTKTEHEHVHQYVFVKRHTLQLHH